ncbi:TPA: hypothetical protein NIK52_005079 [Pseudomonas aeruginosa]|nr:hypothetical protein [Pseudomonas aeruginosa]MDV6869055.1 hypothetical protein [Pseudomonas aeruginosa]MDV6888871.1 hypothetical protein [Pseudomonas aeruginosa]HCF7667553.1 hypothetical protein [Pseudomonas aeruginosa]
MNTYCPTFWPNGPAVDHSDPMVELNDLLPAIGSTTSACFDRYDRPTVGETVRLLWIPPVSDINGWSEQPSEVSLSYLLTAIVVSDASEVDPSHSSSSLILRGKYRYDLRILSRERLLSALKATHPDSSSWRLPVIASDRGVTQLWDDVLWCGKASVEGLIYLAATTRSEAFMEMLLDQEGDELIGLFSLHVNPGGAGCSLGKQRLTSVEQRVIRRAMNRAQLLEDSQAPYIITEA